MRLLGRAGFNLVLRQSVCCFVALEMILLPGEHNYNTAITTTKNIKLNGFVSLKMESNQ